MPIPTNHPPVDRALLRDDVYGRLRDAIVDGTFAPGEQLKDGELAAWLGVSRTPVREALRQLQASGLVELNGRKMLVARITPTRTMEMFEVMAEIEAVCVRLATYRMTLKERGELTRIHESSLRAVERGDVDTYDTLNGEFHMALYKAAHNSFLQEVALSARARLVALRRVQLRQKGRMLRSRSEHDGVMQAIAEGDAETASRRMRAHMLSAAAAFDAYITKRENAE